MVDQQNNATQDAARAAWQARMQARATGQFPRQTGTAAPPATPPAAQAIPKEPQPAPDAPAPASPETPLPRPAQTPQRAAAAPVRRLHTEHSAHGIPPAASAPEVPAEPGIPAGSDVPAAPSAGGRRVYTLLMAAFGLLFVISAGVLLRTWLEDRQDQKEYTELRQTARASLPGPSAERETLPDTTVDLAALHAQKPDLVGWITLTGTNLDYPVMYKPDREDYYLRRNTAGEYSRSGAPYLEERCTLTEASHSNNLIIYGHHMQNGTMFSALVGYAQADFAAEHPAIEFNTLYGGGSYEVFASFAIDVEAEPEFAYDTYTDLSPDQFAWYVDEVLRRSDIDTGIRPAYGAELLTLSTCEDTDGGKRRVVCACRLPDA